MIPSCSKTLSAFRCRCDEDRERRSSARGLIKKSKVNSVSETGSKGRGRALDKRAVRSKTSRLIRSTLREWDGRKSPKIQLSTCSPQQIYSQPFYSLILFIVNSSTFSPQQISSNRFINRFSSLWIRKGTSSLFELTLPKRRPRRRDHIHNEKAFFVYFLPRCYC